jgi:phage virion morphogenesis protein
MPGAGITVTIDDAALLAELDRLGAAAAGPRPALERIGAHLEFTTQLRFERENSPDGKRWSPSKRARKQGGQTLTDSGRLRASITHVIHDTAVDVGTNVIYAAIHQFGGKITQHARSQRAYFRISSEAGHTRFHGFAKASKANFERWVTIGQHVTTMPARPFLGVDAADLDEIRHIITHHLAGNAP